MKILIIRHGEPDYSIDSLTEKGWREAELLSERLVKMNIDEIYCSPLGRAQDTAKPTLEKLGMKAETLPWLEEFRGKIPPYSKTKQTHPWDIHPAAWQNDKAAFDKDDWVNSEIVRTGNSAEIYKETKEGMDALLAKYGYVRDGMMFHNDNNDEKTIALFCHFALGAAVVGYMAGISPFLMWNSFFMPPSSVTTLISSEVKKGDIFFRCMQFGDTSHLYAEGEPISKAGLLPEIYDPNSYRNI